MKKVLDELSLLHPPTWQTFKEEFNAAYGNLLGELKKKYPSLTEKDLLFIALSVLGLDVNDIGYIFGTTDRTLWNRRQFIKNRIGCSKMDFEEWIQSLRDKK